MNKLNIVGAGMAGCEAAWQAVRAGVPVRLFEMRPKRMTEAHQTGGFAELVCSNSFRSNDSTYNAVGLLHEEMKRLDGLIITTGYDHQVPAGAALAVDREGFSQAVTAKLRAHPMVEVVEEELTALPGPEQGLWVIATGPLTSGALAQAIREETGEADLAFFDAIAPIVLADSIDMSRAWRQSRYDKAGPGGDTAAYINCAMDEAQYNTFLDALIAAPKTEFKEWETNTPYFEGCLPIEVMAQRGRETLRFGPMKPVGLTNPHAPERRPHAVVQLRQDNALGTLWNMVGFQTKLKHGAQADVFRLIPGLENAVFARLGGIHRNTFLNSPKLLDGQLRLKSRPWVRFAGQITGVEGYVESAAMGLLAGRFAAAQLRGEPMGAPSATTALGALLAHITGGHLAEGASFQPMNVNFGLFPDMDAPTHDEATGKRLKGTDRGRARKAALSARALRDLSAWASAQRVADAA